MTILSELDLHPCLRARVRREVPAPVPSAAAASGSGGGGFVLYLPSVCLRLDQNPAFAVACHAANRLGAPLVVLAVIVDDASHARPGRPHRFPPRREGEGAAAAAGGTGSPSPSPSPSSVVAMTSRRLAFALQALSHACALWSAHGAAVGVRIHADGARAPDHLTLASHASFVVTDEPFVSPYATLVERAEGACRRFGVECIRVDGSCTVPPAQVLKKRRTDADGGDGVRYDGVPAKAYQWQRKTERLREGHLRAAMEGHFDAPELEVKMEDEDLFAPVDESRGDPSGDEASIGRRLAHLFPARWKAKPTKDGGDGVPSSVLPSAPDVRPLTSRELHRLSQNDDDGPDDSQQNGSARQPTHRDRKVPFHDFALKWPGADPTVPPCTQTIGTTTRGMRRWDDFVRKGLDRYGRDRNDARLVHAPSRMSAYLNLGVVSIFRVVDEVKRAQRRGGGTAQAKGSRWNKSGPDKFQEEVVKWREMSYAHAFSRGDYDDVGSLPRWSVECLNGHTRGGRHTLEQLANGTTGDAKWDAMQRYLVKTGELHNNVRMTWGKTVVEWAGCSVSPAAGDACSSCPAQRTLRTLCYLNDRFALDGLSPPSYAGLLWCMGWTDKPSGTGAWTIPMKPASRYRLAPEDFRTAERRLLADFPAAQAGTGKSGDGGIAGGGLRGQPSVLDMMKMPSPHAATTNASTRGNAESKRDKDDTKPSPSKGLKRNGSITIDTFFSKGPKKQRKGHFRVVG